LTHFAGAADAAAYPSYMHDVHIKNLSQRERVRERGIEKSFSQLPRFNDSSLHHYVFIIPTRAFTDRRKLKTLKKKKKKEDIHSFFLPSTMKRSENCFVFIFLMLSQCFYVVVVVVAA